MKKKISACRLILTPLVICLFLPLLPCQSVNDDFTAGVVNGRAWKKMGSSKVVYIMGCEDGYVAALTDAGTSLSTSKTIYDEVFPKKLTRGEIISEIDKVYEEGSNALIPVVEVLRWIDKKVKGASPEALQEEIARMRKKWNK